MSSIQPPPTYQPLITDQTGKAALEWLLFFDEIYRGDTGVSWTPTFTSLANTGGAPTVTGRVYKLSAAISFFSLNVVPVTNTTSTAGTTYINNFPLTMSADGICFAVSGNLGSAAGMCDKVSNKIYVPAWSAVTVPLTIVGIVQAS